MYSTSGLSFPFRFSVEPQGSWRGGLMNVMETGREITPIDYNQAIIQPKCQFEQNINKFMYKNLHTARTLLSERKR